MYHYRYFLFSVFLCICIKSTAQSEAFTVTVKGKGAPVLLFPGFTCPAEVWDGMIDTLSKKHECHVFTFAGFGNVPPIEKPWLPQIKEAVSSYISEQKLHNSTIIGHSMGGTLGLWLACENEYKFNKIIVIDALASTGAMMMPNFNAESITYDNPYSLQLLKMDENSFKVMASQMAKGMTLNENKRDLIAKWIINSDRKTYVHGYTDLLKLDLRQDLAKIKTHVTILAATQPYGLETVKQTYTKQYEKLKDYDIKFAENSAHFIMFDQPEWLIEAINAEL